MGNWTRRRVIATAGATAAGTALWSGPAWAAPTRTIRSQNGWPVVDAATVRQFPVEGSDAVAALLPGDVATVLLHVARRFSYEIDALRAGDVTGHRTERGTGPAYESNYLSGTAIAIHADRYPAGATGNYFPRELLTVRDILAECAGVVRWGGDDRTAPNESHFQIDVPPGTPRLATLAATIRGWNGHHGQGAGAPHDPLDPPRRTAARDLERRQRQ